MQYHGELFGKVGRKMIPLALTSEQVDDMERRLKIIASYAACVSDEWLATQPDGIRKTIANIRLHAPLGYNDQAHRSAPEAGGGRKENDQ